MLEQQPRWSTTSAAVSRTAGTGIGAAHRLRARCSCMHGGVRPALQSFESPALCGPVLPPRRHAMEHPGLRGRRPGCGERRCAQAASAQPGLHGAGVRQVLQLLPGARRCVGWWCRRGGVQWSSLPARIRRLRARAHAAQGWCEGCRGGRRPTPSCPGVLPSRPHARSTGACVWTARATS